MTIEYILLFGLFAFILVGAFSGNKGPVNVFKDSAPRLGARMEQHISVGHSFNFPSNAWQVPAGGAPSSGTP